MFLVVRLWDAFADLIAGRLVDRTMTRWGKFRPFILFFAVPLLFLSFLTFRVPAGLGDGTKLLYAYLTYAVLGLLYSLVNIPYGSLASAMTQSVNERAKLVAARAFGAAVGGVLLSYYIGAKVSDVRKLRTTLAPADYQARVQSIFTQTTLAFIVLGSICYFLTFLLTKEGVVRTQPSVSMKETFATLKVNKPLGILCAASFFYLIGLFAVGGSSAYYAQYILGDIAYTGPMALVNSGIALLITPIIPWLIGKFGKKNVFQYCGLFTVVGGVSLFFVPAGALVLALVFLAIKGVGASLINTSCSASRLTPSSTASGRPASGRRAPPTHCSPSPARSRSRSVVPWVPRCSPPAGTSRLPRPTRRPCSPSRRSRRSGSRSARCRPSRRCSRCWCSGSTR